MTKEELIALGEKTPEESIQVEETATPVETREVPKIPIPAKAEFPEDTPEWAKKRIGELHGKNAAFKTQLEQERNRAENLQKKYDAAEKERQRLRTVEIPKWEKIAAENAKSRFDLIEKEAAKNLEESIQKGDLTAQTMSRHIGTMVEANVNKKHLEQATREIPDEPIVETPKPVEDTNKYAVPKDVFLQDMNAFLAENSVDLNAPDGTPEGMKKNIALQHDRSAVQLGYPVGSYKYWQHIKDGLRRNAPEERSESGMDHTETAARQTTQSRAPIPSVAAPAARSAQSVNNSQRQKVVLGPQDLAVLKLGASSRFKTEDLEAAILAEKQKEL